MPFKSKILTLFAWLSFYPSIQAADFPQDFFEKLKAPLKGLSSIEFTTKRQTVLNPLFFSEKEITSYAYPKGSTHAKLEGPYFYYDIDFVFPKSPNIKSLIVTFNPRGYQQFKKHSRVLYISEKTKKNYDFLLNNEDIFLPYSFAILERKKNAGFCLTSLDELTQNSRWMDLEKDLQFIKMTDDYVLGKLEGMKVFGWDKTFTYTIKFSKKHSYFPLEWDLTDENLKTTYSFKVLDVSSAPSNHSTFYYPKNSEYKYYGGLSDIPVSTEPRTTAKIEIEMPKINESSLGIEDGAFDIDPSIANSIYDTDHNVVLEVPK